MEELYVGGKVSGPTCWNDERLFEPVDGGGGLSLDDASDFAVGVDGGVLVSRSVLPGYPDYGKEEHLINSCFTCNTRIGISNNKMIPYLVSPNTNVGTSNMKQK